MTRRGYGDLFPDTPENKRTQQGFGTGRDQLASAARPTNEQRAEVRRYVERVAPDLVDMLGLA